MDELAEISIENGPTSTTVFIKGEVDISNTDEIGGKIEAAAPGPPAALVVDLSETRYMDSAGLAMLLRLADRFQTQRQEFRVFVPDDAHVRRVFELTGMNKLLGLDQ